MDDEGYFNIVGRIKDMVIRGGENVYPREIEEFLYRHPKIQDVQVIGVPDDAIRRGDSAPGSSFKPGATANEEEIRDFCQGQIAHYKVPRYVKFVDELPDDGHRQDPEIHDARADDRRTGAEDFRRRRDRAIDCPKDRVARAHLGASSRFKPVDSPSARRRRCVDQLGIDRLKAVGPGQLAYNRSRPVVCFSPCAQRLRLQKSL